MQISSDGIVVRERSVDDDRILQILTRDYGVITAYARGAKKPRGKLTSTTELFCYCRFQIFKNKDRYTIDSADLEESFFQLRQEIMKLSLASYIADLFSELAPKEEEAGEYLRLLLNCLHMLKTGRRTPGQIKAICELRLMTMAGYMPDLVGCRGCGAFEDEKMGFLVKTGELVCSACEASPEDGQIVFVPLGVLAAMRHILYCDFEKLFSFNVAGEGMNILGLIAEQYLLCQIQKRPKSLDFYESLQTTGSMADPV